MNLKSIYIKNFRRLKNCLINLDKNNTIFVGANNSGKTSATHVFQLFLNNTKEKFSIYDFSADCWEKFNSIGIADKTEYESIVFPTISMDLWFELKPEDIHRVIDLLPNLDWNHVPVGIRLEFAPKNPQALLENFHEALYKSKQAQNDGFHPWPKSLVDYLTKCLSDEYEIRYYVLDYAKFDLDLKQCDDYSPKSLERDKERSGAKILKSLLRVDFLHAQRHLSDLSLSSRSENLSSRLNKFYERNLRKSEDDFNALRALYNSESQLSNHLGEVFKPLLNNLSKLGYPGLTNPHLIIKAILDPEKIMKQNATLYYALDGAASSILDLPDKYNGLGFKNLIYMVIELLDFHARWLDDKDDRALLHLVIIEEPEAHLHAQLQQVFIKQVQEILHEGGLESQDVNFYTNQLIITTHSPHIIYESGFKPIRYFRRSIKTGIHQESEVLNLSNFSANSKGENQDFLERYMKLTHCDLFFADAAILVEGNVERLLLPLMIEKLEVFVPQLKSSYLSILEVGGAFAYRFKELIEFLGLTTLVITDLDSVYQEIQSAIKNPKPKACMVEKVDAKTSNQTLIQWLPKLVEIQELLNASEEQKTQQSSPSAPANVYVSYQTLQNISYRDENNELAGRTIEESFALENLSWCQNKENKSIGLRVKETVSCDLLAIRERIFKRVKSSSFNKTNFALSLMTTNDISWKVPAYIKEGLIWLNGQLTNKISGQVLSKSEVGL